MAAARRRLSAARPAALAALLLAAGVAVAPGPSAHGQPAQSPVGLWRTVSDKTGLESGQVQIWQQDGRLYGRVTGIVDPAKRDALCQKCSGDRHDQKVMGMQIIRGLQPDGERWDGGEILDPESGDTYRCSVRLIDGGRQLVVRGFIGISLFGRSQTWTRVG